MDKCCIKGNPESLYLTVHKHGVSERIRRILDPYDIQLTFKPRVTNKHHLSHPKDPIPFQHQSCATCSLVTKGLQLWGMNAFYYQVRLTVAWMETDTTHVLTLMPFSSLQKTIPKNAHQNITIT